MANNQGARRKVADAVGYRSPYDPPGSGHLGVFNVLMGNGAVTSPPTQ